MVLQYAISYRSTAACIEITDNKSVSYHANNSAREIALPSRFDAANMVINQTPHTHRPQPNCTAGLVSSELGPAWMWN